MAGAVATEGTQKGKKKHHFLAGVALSLGLVLAFLVFFSHQGLYHIYRLRQERQALDQETARLAAENTRLACTIDRLRNDPEMIQDLIRRELNLVKKNDIIIQLPPQAGKKPALPPAAHAQAGPQHLQPGGRSR
jgi:cell division protein FtsB